MQEVIRRRYTRVLKEQLPLPDLIIVDGGKGQIEVAREVLEDELGLSIPIAGLAKDEKHRTSELLYGEPPVSIPLKKQVMLFTCFSEYKMKSIASLLHFISNNIKRTLYALSLMKLKESVQNVRNNY